RAKAMDLLSWKLSIDDRASMKPIIEKLAVRCREKYGVEIRKMTRRGLRKDLDKFAEVYNSAWSENWGFVPYSKEDLDANALQKRMGGKLLPTGWWDFLTRNRYCDRLRVGFLGVKPEWQHTGVAALLYVEHFEAATRSNLKHGEAGFILETNHAMNSGLEAMNGRVVKTYRVYERRL